MDDDKEKLLKRITKGAKYFYNMKPSEFSRRFHTEWNHLMQLCKMIQRYEEERVEKLVNEILLPLQNESSLPESSDKADSKKDTAVVPPSKT